MGQPAQDREALAGGVRPGRQPLVRQRLPGREVPDPVLAEQRPERGGQFLGLARGRGHRERDQRPARGRLPPCPRRPCLRIAVPARSRCAVGGGWAS